MPDIGIESTKIHPPPHFSQAESIFFDADEIEAENGPNSGDKTSYQVFLNDFLEGSQVASRTFRYVCLDALKDTSLHKPLGDSNESNDHKATKRASKNGFDKVFHEFGTTVFKDSSGSSGGGFPVSSKTSSNASESPQKAAYKAWVFLKFISIANNHYDKKGSEGLRH